MASESIIQSMQSRRLGGARAVAVQADLRRPGVRGLHAEAVNGLTNGATRPQRVKMIQVSKKFFQCAFHMCYLNYLTCDRNIVVSISESAGLHFSSSFHFETAFILEEASCSPATEPLLAKR